MNAGVRRALHILVAALLSVPVTLVVATALAPPASADPLNLFVKSEGGSDSNNNDCQNVPCRTLAYAVSKAAAGATIHVAGAVAAAGAVVTKNVTITGERFKDSDPAIIVGSSAGSSITVQSGGDLHLAFVTTLDGRSSLFGGALAVLQYGSAVVTDSVFTGAFASIGGAIGIAQLGSATVRRSTFDTNDASYGGAIGAAGEVLIEDSTFVRNTANMGGGVFGGSATVVRSTFVDNEAAGYGGAVAATRGGRGVMTVVASTIGPGNGASSSNVGNFDGGRVELLATVLQHDGDTRNCINNTVVVSLGYNVSSDTSCAFSGPNDATNTGPLVAPIADNGGPTKTMALLTGAPAHSVIPANTTVTVDGQALKLCARQDQRGYSSVSNQPCDSGAYEADPAGPFAEQTITFNLPAEHPYDLELNLAGLAVASSELPVTYASENEDICHVDGTIVAFYALFEPCPIAATQAGSLSFAPASVTEYVTAVERVEQEPLYLVPAEGRVGESVELTTSGGSGTGAVTFETSNNTATGCVLTSVSGAVLLTAETSGYCRVDFAKAGDHDFMPATGHDEVLFRPATEAPRFTSAASATFNVSAPKSVTIAASGPPAPALSVTGALPSGVTFLDNGDGTATLSGTPATGTVKTWPLTITADNGVDPDAIQSFTLTVGKGTQPAPTVTSTSGTALTPLILTAEGGAGTGAFTYQLATTSNSAGCVLNSGPFRVTAATSGVCVVVATKAGDDDYFSSNPVNGYLSFAKATPSPLAITPSMLTLESLPQTLSTTGGSGSGAVTFALDSAGSAGCAVTSGGSLTATSGGSCSITATKAADATYDQGSVTSTIDIVRTNVAPSFSSPAIANFTVGHAGSFNITSEGTPTPTVSHDSGAVPSGLTLVINADGTATLSGTPALGTVGTTTLQLVSDNGVAPAATQALKVVIGKADQAPLTVTSTSGTALSALTLTSSGGTGTGATTYAVTAGTAGCALSNDGTQITAAKSGVCAVTATRAADANYNAVSSLPTTVTFAKATQAVLEISPLVATRENGASLSTTGGSGTGAVTFELVAAGTAGCAVTSGGALTATSLGTCSVKATKAGDDTYLANPVTATITVERLKVAPTITSANTVTFTVGQPGAFTVASTGYPTAALASSGALPTGVTFTDNGDGTATLAGTPADGTATTYPLTLTADNDTEPNASQSFTLVVALDSQAALSVTSTNGTAMTPLALTTAGGSGSGVVTYAVSNGTATGCAVSASTPYTLVAATAGTCLVTATKAGDGRYAAVSSAVTAVAFEKAATRLVARPATVLQSVLSLKVTFSATLTSAANGAAIPGATVNFAQAGSTCSAVTNSAGVATCSVTILNIVYVLSGQSYSASYPGSPAYLPSSTTGASTL